MIGKEDNKHACVFVTRQLVGSALERLADVVDVDVWPGENAPPREDLLDHARRANGIITQTSDRIDAALLDACPSLRVVSNAAVGYDNLDVSSLTKRRIPAGNTPGVLTDATADLTFALILCVARRVIEGRDAVKAGRFHGMDPTGFLGLELFGSTLGVIGVGRIGEAVIQRAHGFGMKTIAVTRSPRPIEKVRFVSLTELLATSDVVTIHVPLSAETRHLISHEELSLMKLTAVIVNTARGAVIDEKALCEALTSGSIAGAGLDVTEEEPIRAESPLLSLPNCVVLPHIGSATVVARSHIADMAVENVLAGLSGQRLPHCVNPEVYGP